MITIKRTPLTRLLRAKEVEIFTQGGKISFYLRENETLCFFPEFKGKPLRPSFGAILFGALADTRALGGITFFAAFLGRTAQLFGRGFFDRLISSVFTTAETLSAALAVVHLAVPKIAVALAVFLLLIWAAAFFRKLFSLSRFELRKEERFLLIKSGVITLYETTLVPNASAAIARKTASSLLLRRTALYLRGVMILPCADKKTERKFLRAFLGIRAESFSDVKSPPRAYFGLCGVPLSVFSGSLCLLFLLAVLFPDTARLLRTALFMSAITGAYHCALGVFYTRNALSAFSGEAVKLSFIKLGALYTAYIPPRLIAQTALYQSLFERRKPSPLCTLSVSLPENRRYKARLIPRASVPRD